MNAANETITVGSRVRFKEALEPGDESARFDVIEDNGDRLLIRFVCNLQIPPVQVVHRSDVFLANEQ
jgi:hypothetical protein